MTQKSAHAQPCLMRIAVIAAQANLNLNLNLLAGLHCLLGGISFL